MKYLKPFNESLDESKIHAICKQYNIYNYDIVNGLVNVNGEVYLSSLQLDKLPLKFGIVREDFYCDNNKLISLEGAPYKVSGDFNCSDNKLTTLEYGPKEVGGDFICTNNELTTLEYGPTKVGRDFNCSNNKLTTIKGAPLTINNLFNCNNNELTTLVDGPTKVRYYYCSYNKLTTLEGLQDVFSVNLNFNPISKWWDKIDDISKLDIFLDMNINAEDPDDVNQQKIDYILNY